MKARPPIHRPVPSPRRPDAGRRPFFGATEVGERREAPPFFERAGGSSRVPEVAGQSPQSGRGGAPSLWLPRRGAGHRRAAPRVQRAPGVGFDVRGIRRQRGRLDDPDTAGAEISFPLSFAVTSPLDATADVAVTGAAGDPCTDWAVGWVQTVHSQWLHGYYWGRGRGDGSSIYRVTVPLPIRDGELASEWYADTAQASPAACGGVVSPHMDDYPTIQGLRKVHRNSVTGQDNYLTGLVRGMHFVTTLVAKRGADVRPLRFFYWNYWMDVRFRPNHAVPADPWPHEWRINRASLGGIGRGRAGGVPLFTTATPTYNHSLVHTMTERP